jgi:hypothetical protein
MRGVWDWYSPDCQTVRLGYQKFAASISASSMSQSGNPIFTSNAGDAAISLSASTTSRIML